jgi:hypothetical protein
VGVPIAKLCGWTVNDDIVVLYSMMVVVGVVAHGKFIYPFGSIYHHKEHATKS